MAQRLRKRKIEAPRGRQSCAPSSGQPGAAGAASAGAACCAHRLGRSKCREAGRGGARSALLQGTSDHIRAAVVVAMMSTYKDLLTRYVELHTHILFPEGLTDFGDWPDIAGARSPSPLMVLYDIDDILFSLEGMQDADKRLREIYTKSGAKENYHGEFFPGPHKFDIEMQEKAFQWLKANLQN